MLVSEFELQLSDNHEGIIELPDDAPVGESFAKWTGLDDPVIEINLTPNRADCTGVHGIARDLAAADMGKFKDAGIKPIKGEFPCPVSVTLDFGATPSLCPGFRAASCARRQERAVAGVDAAAAHRDRAAADQCAGRHHQLHHLRPRPARCTCSTPPRCAAISWSAAAATAKRSPRSTARPTRSTTACASSPTRTASSRSPASWAARRPAARRRPPTC